MPYNPPKGDQVDFNFTGDVYAPPRGDEANFNFLSLANDRLPITQQWGVTGSFSEVCWLDQQWQVLALVGDGWKLTQQWEVEPTTETERLLLLQRWEVLARENGSLDFGQQWAVEFAPTESLKLTQQWQVQIPLSESELLTQQWGILSLDSDTFGIGQLWGVEIQGAETLPIAQQWVVNGLIGNAEWQSTQQWLIDSGSERLDLGQRWGSAGLETELLRVGQEWDTLGIDIEIFRFDQQWEVLVPVNEKFDLNQAWYFRYSVEQGFVILYPNTVSVAFSTLYNLGMTKVSQEFVSRSDIVGDVAQEFILDVNLSTVVGEFVVNYSLATNVSQEFISRSDIVTNVAQEFISKSDIVNHNVVLGEFVAVYSILADATSIVETAPTLTINGVSILLEDVDISIDEGQFAWTCQATLLDPAHYSLFNKGDSFTIDLGGEVYSFLLDSKSLSRSGQVALSASVSGISPTASLSDPRADKITKTWETAVLAKDVANEVTGAYGVDWRILDWSLPAYRLGVDSQTPMEIVQLIARAAGGVPETEPNGDLYVRYLYPKSVTEYSTLTPDQEYSDTEHNFSMQEQFQTQKVVNKLRVLDVADDAKRDRVEFEQDENDHTRGKLKVFPSPWRESVIVENTSLPSVSSVYVGIETEDLEEVVEVVEGKGNVSHPIYSVQSLTWLYANLTGVSFDTDSTEFKTTHPTNKESLLKINYRTRYLRFDAAAFSGAQVQFLVKDVT